MTRRWGILRTIGIAAGALVIAIVIAAIVVVRSAWFQDFVRQKIVAAAEEGTGGKVEIGSFALDPLSLHAVMTGFVIHGSEPAGAAPFLRVPRAEVYVRLLTGRLVDIVYLGIDRPQANIMVFPDGTSNVPTPKTKPNSNKTALETVVDLAVRRADLINGVATFNSEPQPLDLKANNLRVKLVYNSVTEAYRGDISLQPVHVISGRNAPLDFTIDLPVELRRDRIDFRNASVSTGLSRMRIDASIQNLRSPEVSAHVSARLALADLKNAANMPLQVNASGVPAVANLQADAFASRDRIQVAALRLQLGRSNLEVSGALKDPAGKSALDYRAKLDLGELGRFTGSTVKADGAVAVKGAARLDAANRYDVTGAVEARGVSVQQGATRVSNIDLATLLHLNPQLLTITNFRLDALGAELAANASIQNFARFQFDGDLRHLDIRKAAQALGQQVPYSGSVFGPISAQGDLKAPGAQGIAAQAHLSIAPGQSGIPVSGRLAAIYDGQKDDLQVLDSRIALPHSALTVNGSIGRRLDVSLVSHDLHDLLAAMPAAGAPDIRFQSGGQLALTGVVTGQLSSPRIGAHVAMNRFQVEARQFDALALDVRADSSGASFSNGVLDRGPMNAQFSGAVGLRNWKTAPTAPVSLQASIRNGDLADIMALAGQPSQGYSGALAAQVNVGGTIGNPRGGASVQIAKGEIEHEPFDAINLQANMHDQLVAVPTASIATPAGRVDLTAEFQHPPGSFASGQVRASLRTTQLQLAQLHTVQSKEPGAAGQVAVSADLRGKLSRAPGPGGGQPEFQPSSVTADVSARSLRFRGQEYGNLSATAQTRGNSVIYSVNSNFAGSALRIDGSTQLARGYPTDASAQLSRLPVERVLALASSNVPVKGYLSGHANVHGTVDNPEGAVNLDLSNGSVYGEPLDAVRARAEYRPNSIVLSQFEAVAGPSRISVTGRYDHPARNFQAGNAQFQIGNSRLDLARIRNAQKLRPGISGVIEIAANGAGSIHAGSPRVTFRDLNAELSAKRIAAKGKNFGDLTLTAKTAAGRLNFNLDSNLADAKIHGAGNAQLTAQYPVSAKLDIDNVVWTRVRELLGEASQPTAFDATLDGCEIAVNGPVEDTSRLRGSLRVARLQVRNMTDPGVTPVTFENQGPIAAVLDNGVARIQSLRMATHKADLQASGSYVLKTRALNGAVNANADLSLLQQLSREVVSSGQLALKTDLRGDLSKPLINGSLELRNASVNYTEIANGIANANGVIQFNGNSAALRDFSAEVGGGKVTLTGYANYAQALNFGLNVKAAKVLALLQPGLSAVVDANLHLSGRQQASLLSGDVTVDKITYAPTSDVGSILARANPAAQTGTPSPLLNNMKLDVQVRTSPGLIVQSAMAENLDFDANLRVHGTAAQPGAQGRITVTSGQLLFFGSTYRVNAGTISFFNPLRIDPILDLSLATQAQGVRVTLRVTGPVDNMNLSYTSNPPLEFEQIVNLLATGKTPTTDPNILANQPAQPPQTFQQMGESALLSQTVAAPVANQLKRVFGVSKLSIDPMFTSGSYLPEAQVTLQQRISNAITFTYTTAVNDPNTQIVRVQWAFNPRWSSIAMRDQNGIVSIRLLYKKQFR